MQKVKKKFLFIVEKTDTGFSMYSEDLPIFSTAKTSVEIYSNILEALNLFLEEEEKIAEIGNIKVEVDLQQFFQYYRVINAKYLAQRIGMNESLLSQYVQGRKKPSSKQSQRILQGIHEIGRELTEINFIND